jgi:hypothetical protein
VLVLNASLSKEHIPQVANVLAALVVVQACNLGSILKLNKGLEHLECFKASLFFLTSQCWTCVMGSLESAVVLSHVYVTITTI